MMSVSRNDTPRGLPRRATARSTLARFRGRSSAADSGEFTRAVRDASATSAPRIRPFIIRGHVIVAR